jgi:hypothetical protein
MATLANSEKQYLDKLSIPPETAMSVAPSHQNRKVIQKPRRVNGLATCSGGLGESSRVGTMNALDEQ